MASGGVYVGRKIVEAVSDVDIYERVDFEQYHVVLFGRLGRDPELKYIKGGQMAVCNASLAVSWGNKGSEVVKWFPIVAFENKAVSLSKMSKGQYVCVIGPMKMNKWTKNSGEEVVEAITTAYDVFGGFKEGKATGYDSTRQAPKSAPPIDDDIPW